MATARSMNEWSRRSERGAETGNQRSKGELKIYDMVKRAQLLLNGLWAEGLHRGEAQVAVNVLDCGEMRLEDVLEGLNNVNG